MRKRSLPLLACTLLCAYLLAPRPARADAASGFMLQGLVGGGANLLSQAGDGGLFRGPVFSTIPTLRLGGMMRPLAIAANVSFMSGATLRSGSYSGTNILVVGPDIMPFVWKSGGGAARLYLLFGFNLGAVINSSGSANDVDLTGGFSVGVGGMYFLHPSFGLGVELGSRTQFTPSDSTLLASSVLYAALSGTFVAGR